MLWHVLVVCDSKMQDEVTQPMYTTQSTSFQLSMRMTLRDVHIHSTM